jgi:hypothetical protein
MDEEVSERSMKEVLFNIIENEEGGHFISLLRNRDRSLVFEKQKMWNTITAAFVRETGSEIPKKRLQSMWTRFKDEFRRDGDNKRLKEFNRSCAQTGSGKGDEEPPGKS